MNAQELKEIGEILESGDPIKDFYMEGDLIAMLYKDAVKQRGKVQELKKENANLKRELAEANQKRNGILRDNY